MISGDQVCSAALLLWLIFAFEAARMLLTRAGCRSPTE
jgi:hypothetical protein